MHLKVSAHATAMIGIAALVYFQGAALGHLASTSDFRDSIPTAFPTYHLRQLDLPAWNEAAQAAGTVRLPLSGTALSIRLIPAPVRGLDPRAFIRTAEEQFIEVPVPPLQVFNAVAEDDPGTTGSFS